MEKKKGKMSLKDFLIDYLTFDDPNGIGITVVDGKFHDKVAKQFPHLKQEYNRIGCEPVPAVMRTLEKLYKEYRVLRNKVNLLSSHLSGFPKWVYTYYIHEDFRMKR